MDHRQSRTETKSSAVRSRKRWQLRPARWGRLGMASVALAALFSSVLAGCVVDGPAPSEKMQEQVSAAAEQLKLSVGTESAVISSAWSVVQLPHSYSEMVVVATPLYGPDSPPLVTRVREAAGSSFQLKVERFDTGTESVGPVEVQYLVVEAGVYDAATHGVTMEAVRYESTETGGKRAWSAEKRSYLNSYSEPVVLGQVMSSNDAAPSVFWSRGPKRRSPPSSTELRVGKHVGEDPDSERATETIGYVVVESGVHDVGGVALEAGVGNDEVRGLDKTASSYPLQVAGPASNAVVSQTAMDGGDGSWAVLRSSGDAGIDVSVDEDVLGDPERRHTTEQVAYLAANPCAGNNSVGNACGEGGTCTASGECVDASSCATWSSGEGVFEGDVTIDGSDTAGDLAQLEGIWCVAGSLTVQETDWTDLAPLSGILGVGSALQISANQSLQSLSGLQNLYKVGQLKLYTNSSLTSLSGTDALTEGRGLELAGNSSLQSLSGLSPLDWSSVWISGNGSLQSLEGLEGIDGAVSYVAVQNEASITSLAALSGISQIAGGLTLFNLDSLEGLQGLEGLQSVGGALTVRYNDVLAGLQTLGALSNIGSASFLDNPSLPQCEIDELLERTGTLCDDCTGNMECSLCGADSEGQACGEIGVCTSTGECRATLEIPFSTLGTARDIGNDGTFDNWSGALQVAWRHVSYLDDYWTDRAVIEFDFADVPEGAHIDAARLHITPIGASYNPGGFDAEFRTYSGDGTAALQDAGLGGTIEALLPVGEDMDLYYELDLTTAARGLLDAGASHMGINVRASSEGLTNNAYDDELVFEESYGSDLFLPPRLVLEIVEE